MALPQAGTPAPPPTINLPWGKVVTGGMVDLTPQAYEFLQRLWAQVQGSGGVVDVAEAIPALMAMISAESTNPGDRRFGVAFSKADISTAALGAIVGQYSSGIPWSMPATLGTSCGRVEVAPIADTDFDLQVLGVSVGTARWEAGSQTPVFIKAAISWLASTDYLDLVTPANLNGMSGAFSLTIMGTKV